MSTLNVEIVSPQKVLLSSKEVTGVVLPGKKGSMGILPHHAPLITSLGAGTIEYTIGNERGSLDIESGFAEIVDNKLIILVSLPAGPEDR
ncbi:MAG: F0F1 ATP synthase subunit epsilon [Abditibacteriota bacterium]|nr:F0F1 ATP synthase subunit epsilon [Abditibacteriota bacterium]